MEPTQHDRQAPRTPPVRADGARQRRGRGQVRAIARAAGRTCSRPGCETPAGATLVFSYREQVARLVELLDEGEPQAYDLCPAHADRTSPPVGWELSDTRPPRSDSPRRLDDDETVAVLAAALRGEVPPTRVDVLEGGRTDDHDDGHGAGAGATDGDAAPGAEDDEDPLRAALEELQRVATPDDDVAVQPTAAMPLRPSEPDGPTAPPGTGADLSWTDLDLAAAAAAVVDDATTAAQDDPGDDLTLW